MEIPIDGSFLLLNGTSSVEALGPSQLVHALEMFIPGLGPFLNFFSTYLKIDLTQYLWSILLVTGVLYSTSYCADGVRAFIKYYFMAIAEVQYSDEMYNYLMYWVSQNGLAKRATHFVVGTQTNSAQVWSDEDDENDVDSQYDGADWNLMDTIDTQATTWDRMKTLRYTPSQGTHFFWYKNHILSFTRTFEDDHSFWSRGFKERIYISKLGRSPQVLKDLLKEAQQAYLDRDGNKTVIYRGAKPYGGSSEDLEWVRCLSRPPRPLSTVVLDEGQKQMVLDDMREYLHPHTRRWYSNRGIPYRRGYLLYGPPGTGKTSICFALAGILHLRIYVASLNSRNMTEDSLSSLFRTLPWRCIVLLEDIDSAGLAVKRADDTENEKDDEHKADASKPERSGANANDKDTIVNKGISFSGFLNVIDGVASSEGRILVMTTNHIEKLDPALLRPGRVDMTVRFGYADTPVCEGLFKAIYSNLDSELQPGQPKIKPVQGNGTAAILDDKIQKDEEKRDENGSICASTTTRAWRHHGKSDEEIASLATEFAKQIPSGEFTPAEVQGYLLKHKSDPDAVVKGANEWVENRREEKKAQKHKAA